MVMAPQRQDPFRDIAGVGKRSGWFAFERERERDNRVKVNWNKD
jgi:hypothetical protein